MTLRLEPDDLNENRQYFDYGNQITEQEQYEMLLNQKARNLINTFHGIPLPFDLAKDCASLAADEIINAIDELEDKTIFINGVWHDGGSEWLKVKERIENIKLSDIQSAPSAQ